MGNWRAKLLPCGASICLYSRKTFTWRAGLAETWTYQGVLLHIISLLNFLEKWLHLMRKCPYASVRDLCKLVQVYWLWVTQGSWNHSVKNANLAIVHPPAEHSHRALQTIEEVSHFSSCIWTSSPANYSVFLAGLRICSSKWFWVCCKILLINAIN